MCRSSATVLLAFAAPLAAAPLDFQRDVRPILSNHCYHCHGPDEHGRKGGLRLDIREEALKPAESGARALVPGQAAASELVTRIFHADADELMPPPAAKKPITEAQKAILKRWVEEGAEYAPHWAFAKPVAPAVPRAAAGRMHNPIDAFVLQKLAASGLKQAPPAEPHALARRLALDLTGLPPAVAELQAFVRDYRAAGAGAAAVVERYVDRLLESPHYGERWARRWLDLARYADTNGYEKDRERSIWPYRDWVIRALNADMPFDRFTVEQLAGDLLPGATLDQKIATGFHRNTMLNEEGGIDPLEFRFHAMTDRVATTGATWLGLTLQCSQCHTHKFDPITHTEYYGLMAFLNNADEPDLDLPDPKLAAEHQARLKQAARLLRELPAKWPAAKTGRSVDAAFAGWLEQQRRLAVPWKLLRPQQARSNLPLLTVQPDGAVLGSGDTTKSDRYDLRLEPAAQPVRAIRLEALPHDSLPAHGPGLCSYEGPKGDFFLGEFQVRVNGRPARIASATESYAKNNFGKNPVSATLATDGDPQTGWSCAGRFGERHEAVFVLAEPAPAGAAIEVTMLFGRHYACSLGHFRLSATDRAAATARDLDDALATLLLKPEPALQPAERQRLFEHFLLTAPELAPPARTILALRRPPVLPTTLVLRERPPHHPRPTHRHHRGEFTQPKEPVQPVTLAVLHPFPQDQPRNRLGFARWLVSPDNPLTPRVVVNRQWSVFFGRGLVRTEEDFGYQGELPSHPELLDWLAVEFVRQGWSLKKLHKLIVLSATYQQSSSAGGPADERLARFPRIRLEAEILRDSLLRAAGLLNPKIGGPSVYPPQPDSVTEVAYGGFKWKPSTGDDRHRRSLYTFSKRTAPFALFTTFDGPTGEACLVRREASNSALQALTSLNDIIVTEAAQGLGRRLAAQSGDETARVTELYLRVLSRPPEPAELEITRAFLARQRGRLQRGELNAAGIAGEARAGAEAALWTLAARALFNLDEFVTKG